MPSKVISLLAAVLALGLAPQEEFPLGLDPTRGEIDGKIAVAFVAQEPDGSMAQSPGQYKVHLALDADPGVERVYPAVTWFQPPPGKYRVWMEGPGRMSPDSLILSYSGKPFKGLGLLGGLRLAPAGTVALADDTRATGTSALRLLHLDSHMRGAHPQREISRRVSGPALKNGVLMPAGPILAALFDSKTQEYTGLTRPVVVAAGGRTPVRPVPPEKGVTHLVALLERPGVLDSFAQDDARPVLTLAAGRREPDVLVTTAERIYAVWYGLSDRRAKLELTSAFVTLPPQDLVLRPGRIERLQARLNRRPGLKVTLQVPEELPLAGSTLEVAAVSTTAVAAQTKVDPTNKIYRFENLPPELLEVKLKTPAGEFRQRADLSGGQDGEAVLEATPIVLRGTVYRNREPHPARIAFHVGPENAIEIETDEDGAYEAMLFRRVLIARVELTGEARPPHLEFFEPAIAESVAVDFHVPANEGKVAVVDTETGRGISGASLVVSSSAADGKTYQQSAKADPEGVAALPPLREGEVAIEASAEGYLPSSEPLRFTVREGEAVSDARIALRPVSAKQILRLTTATGGPAVGAELVATRSPASLETLWSGHADGEGKVEVPREAEGAYLLVRHPGSGFLVRDWRRSDTEDEILWQLPAKAEAPLIVRVVDASGEAVPWASLSLWVDGLRLEASALAWLTGLAPFSNRDGVWVVSNVPAGPLEILAWRGGGEAPAAGSPARSLATELRPPLLEPVSLQVL